MITMTSINPNENPKTDPEPDNKTDQTIEYGSVFEALISGFLTCGDVLDYLLETQPTPSCMIAYKAVCQFSTDQVVNGNPFILTTNQPEYIAIYSLMLCKNGNPGRNDTERMEIAKKVRKISSKLLTVNKFSKTIFIICDVFRRMPIDSNDHLNAFMSRSMNYIQVFAGKVEYEHRLWMRSDCLEPLHKFITYTQWEDDLLLRCESLQTLAPLYWDSVAKPLYQDFVKGRIDTKNTQMKRKTMNKYISLFPGLFPEMENMSDLAYNLNQLSIPAQAYVLGFPIHQYIPSSDVIGQAIKLLDEIGIEKYCDRIRDQNLKILHHHDLGPVELDIKSANENDSLYELITDYNLFDIIRYYSDTHLYYFTGPEFPTVLTQKKNIYTNNKLPVSIISEIGSRLETRMVLELPKAATLRELLVKIQGNTLHDTHDINEPNEPNEQIIPPLRSPNLHPLVGMQGGMQGGISLLELLSGIDRIAVQDLIGHIDESYSPSNPDTDSDEDSDSDNDSNYRLSLPNDVDY